MMINRIEIKEKLEKKFLGFIPELHDIEKLDNKIAAAKDVIKDLDISISHAENCTIYKVLLEWNRENVENTQVQAEILREILIEKYQKYN